MSDEKLVILEFNYLQNKKWQKQAVKSTRIRKSYRTYWFFLIYSDNWKTCNFPSKIGNFQHLPRFRAICEATWIQIFVFLQPMWHQEQSDLCAPRIFQPQGVKQKKYEKKHEILAFKLLLQEIWLKNLTSRKIFWSSNI